MTDIVDADGTGLDVLDYVKVLDAYRDGFYKETGQWPSGRFRIECILLHPEADQRLGLLVPGYKGLLYVLPKCVRKVVQEHKPSSLSFDELVGWANQKGDKQ